MNNKVMCPHCKSKDVDVLSCGTILCHNPKCLRITPREENNNEIQIQTESQS